MAELDIVILAGQVLLGIIVIGIILSGIRIIRPTHRAAVETLGSIPDSKNPESPLLFLFSKNYTL